MGDHARRLLCALGVGLIVLLSSCTDDASTPDAAPVPSGSVPAGGAVVAMPDDLGVDPCALLSVRAAAEALRAPVRQATPSGVKMYVPGSGDTVDAGSCEFHVSAANDGGTVDPDGDRIQVRVTAQRAETIFKRLDFRLEAQEGLPFPALWQPDAETIWIKAGSRIVSVQIVRASATGDRGLVLDLARAVAARLPKT